MPRHHPTQPEEATSAQHQHHTTRKGKSNEEAASIGHGAVGQHEPPQMAYTTYRSHKAPNSNRQQRTTTATMVGTWKSYLPYFAFSVNSLAFMGGPIP